jgi:hypothetical protein
MSALAKAYKRWYGLTNRTAPYEQPYCSLISVVGEHLAGKNKVIDAACGFQNRYISTLVANEPVEKPVFRLLCFWAISPNSKFLAF